MAQGSFFGRKANHTGGLLFVMLCLLLACALGLPGVGHGQANQCWTLVNGVWTYNPACSLTPNAPLKVAVGKQLTVNKTVTLDAAQDNATLNIGLGGTLGSAAYQDSTAFQASGAIAGLSSAAADSLTIGTGSTTFNTSAGLAYTTGMVVTAYYSSDLTQWMQGIVTSYDSTTGVLGVNVLNTGGAGTYAFWTISISGPQGPTGSAGVSGTPVGGILAYGGTVAPAGYVLCDGTAYSRTVTYNALFAAIGTTFGTGDGSTTFNVPDLQGRFPIGMGQGATGQNAGAGTNRVLGVKSTGTASGATAGAETHTLTIAEMPGHTHSTVNVTTVIGNSQGQDTPIPSGFTITGSTGGGGAHIVMNPFLVVNYIIRYQ